MKEQIIHLEPHDDIVSARDKLGWVQATHVLLVFPDDPREPILQRKLDLVILQREATRLRAQLGFITRDPVVIEHASELGIAHFPTIEASHKRNWRTARAALNISREDQPQPLNPDLIEAGSRLRGLPGSAARPLSRRAAMTLTGLVITTILVFLLLTFPGATIYLSPAANQVTITTTISADPAAGGVDLANSLIPARVVGVEVESRATIETSGTVEQPSDKARGIALFTNLVPDQVTIPAGTVVRTSAAQPVRFVTLTDATLPGTVGATVEVSIEAVEGGFEGNLPTGRVNQVDGPLATRLAVANSEPTSGGSVTDVPAISQEDYDRARALLLQQLQQRAYAEMQTDRFISLLDSEFIPIETLTVVLVHSETYDGYVGQPATQLALTMRVTVQGVAIDERLARQVVYARLAEKVTSGFQISPDSLVFRRGEVMAFDGQRRVTFIMQGAGDVSAAIDDEEVRKLVWGRTILGARAQLDGKLPLANRPSIQAWPGFWPFMPLLPARISVETSGQP